jgi:hypothetical protein
MHFTELSAKEVNGRLLDKWELSLFKFAQVLAMCAGDWLQLPEKLNITKEKIQRQRKLLLGLKKYIFKQINKVESITYPVNKKLSENKFIQIYKLETFFKEYFNPLFAHTVERENSYKARQGAHITKKSILAASWGSLIYQNGQRMNWSLLADLYEWFWEKLHNFPYYKSIKPPDDLVNYLTVQYHRHRKEADCIHCIQTYGKNDYLSLLASNGTFVDRFFVYIGDILDIVNRKRTVPKKLPFEQDLVFENNDLIDYLRFALSLYMNYGKIANHRPPPLIVFPDKTWFSTEF